MGQNGPNWTMEGDTYTLGGSLGLCGRKLLKAALLGILLGLDTHLGAVATSTRHLGAGVGLGGNGAVVVGHVGVGGLAAPIMGSVGSEWGIMTQIGSKEDKLTCPRSS